jgi:hypothetical protein
VTRVGHKSPIGRAVGAGLWPPVVSDGVSTTALSPVLKASVRTPRLPFLFYQLLLPLGGECSVAKMAGGHPGPLGLY